MKDDVRFRLSAATDEPSLKSIVKALCEPHGQVVNIQLFLDPQPGQQESLCIVEMGSVEEQIAAHLALGTPQFGNCCIVFAFTPAFHSGRS
ncbi:MAG: RNA-binding protein [Betaproteobacteria bacterium]|nr:RNA-binding protein [Betaproteobacteria bacterium]